MLLNVSHGVGIKHVSFHWERRIKAPNDVQFNFIFIIKLHFFKDKCPFKWILGFINCSVNLLSFIPYGRCSLSGATPDRGKIRAKLCNKLVWDLGPEELQVLLVETTLFSNKLKYSLISYHSTL